MLKNDKLVDAIGMIDEDLVINAREFKKEREWIVVKRITMLAAALALCFIVSVPVLAVAEVEPVQELLYLVAPSIAQRLKPVRKSCVDAGIQMEVVLADIHDDTAEVYIAMKDLESDRIDGTMDLFDSYDIRGIGDSAATCSLAGYDGETGVATFLIRIRQMNKEKIALDKVTFSVTKFMSNKTEFEGLLSDAALCSVDRMPETLEHVNVRGASMKDERSRTVFLKPGKLPLDVPVKGAELSAIGYMDERLHVQMYYEDILNTDNHGWLWLEDENGNRVECAGNTSFWDDENSGSYEEYVFDISYEALGSYKLYGELIVCDTLTKGDWQVTFPMDDIK